MPTKGATAGVSVTIDAADEETDVCRADDQLASQVVFLVNPTAFVGTLTFYGRVLEDGVAKDFVVAAVVLLDGTLASAVTNPGSTIAGFRVDCSGMDGCYCKCTAYTSGSVKVTPNWVVG